MMRDIFIGPPRHWILFVLMLAVLWVMGKNQFHTSDFKIFLLALFAMAVAVLAAVVVTYREGERITREPIDDAE